MNILNEFVALTTKMPGDDPLEAGLRAAVEALGLKPVVWRNFSGRYLCADARVGAYELEVREELPMHKRKASNPTTTYRWTGEAGENSEVYSTGSGFFTVIEAKLAAETWLRQELLQYIPYCIPVTVEGVEDAPED